ncbi:Uncharacterised protein [Vibrio cholerae]|nr:Uncharacterised protein [Vibrio cholerae]
MPLSNQENKSNFSAIRRFTACYLESDDKL